MKNISIFNLATLCFGLLALVAGSIYENLPDWDIGISLLMGLLTFFTAPLCIKWIIQRNYKMMPIGILFAWLTIDVSYCLYNFLLEHPYFREANFSASTPLYFMMGLFWYVDWPLAARQAGSKIR